MRKAELLETNNRQKKQIEDQKKQIETQLKATDNVMDIFKALAGGGEISVHIYPDKAPSYFVRPKDSNTSDCNICSRKIFEGLYSRGLLAVTGEHVYEDFSVQCYALRISKEQ